jgi:hypothetical protein
LAVVVRVYVTDVPETEGVLTLAPAVTPVRVAPTTAGTEDERVVTIADAVPTVMVLTGAVVALAGHTRMPVAATLAVSRRRVDATTNVNVVAVAAPAYVAENDPEVTDVASALNVPLDDTSALAGVTGPNVTGTKTDAPESSVSPVANVPSATVVASKTTVIALEVSVVVSPSGERVTTSNETVPDAGSAVATVYDRTTTVDDGDV